MEVLAEVPVENPIEENSAKRQKLSMDNDESLPKDTAAHPAGVNPFEPTLEQPCTPIQARRPLKPNPNAPKKEFIRRLKFPMKTSEDAGDDYYIYISSYDGVKRPSAATIELIKHELGEPKYKLSLSYNELEWLIENLPSKEEVEEQVGNFVRCPSSRNNLTIETLRSAAGYAYLKLQTEARYKKFLLIGSAVVDQISANAAAPFCLLTNIELFKTRSAESFGKNVTALFFAALRYYDRTNGAEWKGLWKKIAALFGLTNLLDNEEKIAEAKQMADSYAKGTVDYPSTAHIMGTILKHVI